MGSIAAYCGGLLCCSQLRSSNSRIVSGLSVLEQVDKELMKGDERAALSLVKDLQGKPGGLRCFGAARQVPFCNLLFINIFSSDQFSRHSPYKFIIRRIYDRFSLFLFYIAKF